MKDPGSTAFEPSPNERAADFAARHLRLNFLVLCLDAATFSCGLAFFESATVLPVLLSKLNASDILIGVARLIQVLGFTLPALAGAHYIHGRTLHKPFLLKACAIGRSGLITLPFLFAFFAKDHPALALVWFFIAYSMFSLTDGAGAVSWFDIIGKTIPEKIRGRFFGTMQALSGLAAVAAGFGVKAVLERWTYPTNFSILAVGLCVGVMGSLIFLILVREPKSTLSAAAIDSEAPRFGEYVRGALPLLRANPRLTRIIIVRFLLDGACMALPFYVLYAERDLHKSLLMVGVFAIAQSIGRVCCGPLWGWLTDRFGAIAGLRAVAICTTAIPIAALAAGQGVSWAILAAFALIGGMQDGIWMAGYNAVLSSVTDEDRPLAVGVCSLLQSPGALFGPIGGFLAQGTSYATVFIVATVFGLAALFASSIGMPLVTSPKELEANPVTSE